MTEQKTVAFHTLGCKLNFSETSTIARLFSERGYKRIDFNEQADVYVINTCSVTEVADKKCRYFINKAIHTSPNAFVVVVGCYSQLQPEKISEIHGVDLILGTQDKFRLVNFLEDIEKRDVPIIHNCHIEDVHRFDSAYSLGGRTRSFLKIQDGCDYPCTYCTIPLARGNSRNDTIENVIKNANEIASKGFKEIVLTGVNIGDFGRTNDENFFDLLKQLDNVDGIERYRISSIEPNLLTDEIICFVAQSKKFLPHFHVPLQSGSDKILALMQRRYNCKKFEDRILSIKNILPDAFIGIDIMVGFPGETNIDFEDSYNFIDRLDISFLHVFTYSERPNTKATDFVEKVSHAEKEKRSKMLHQLSEKKHRAFYEKHLNTTAKVLFESQKIGDFMFGFTGNYIKVQHQYNSALVNNIVNVRLIKILENTNVFGEIVQ